MTNPKVSIIIPNYNHARFLERRIQSVLNQTYHDFEVIYLDDASTDHSLEVFSKYASDPRIRAYINGTNSGSPFKQWNKGVKLAQGEYIWIAESDDFAHERFLEELVPKLDMNPEVGLAFCESWMVDEWDNILASWEEWMAYGADKRWENDFIGNGREECRRQLMVRNSIPNASAVLMRRDVYEKVGCADETMKVCGDWLMWVNILTIYDLAFVAKPLNYFRTHPNTCRRKNSTNGVRIEEYYPVLNHIISHLEVSEDVVKQVCDRMATRWVNTMVSRKGWIPWNRNLKIYRIAHSMDPRLLSRLAKKITFRPMRAIVRRLQRRLSINSEYFFPTVAITQGPKYHWFGYYDKLQFDLSCRYVLGMEVEFEHRSPKPDDVIRIGMVDLQDGNRWIELGESRTWCWQQGCMLQWRPGSENEIMWNDRQDNHFVCHILNVRTGEKRTLPHPIYSIDPDGRTAVAPDFRRIQDLRPGYGYAGLPDPCANELAPKNSGIFRIDLESGKRELIISIADIAKLGKISGNMKDAKHYFNHLLFNSDGSRFIFLHRWRSHGQQSFGTRMLTAKINGTDIHIVDDYGRTSHFIWRDKKHILAWAWHYSHRNAFYLYEDGTDKVEVVGKGVMNKNGHCSYLRDNKWILNDTYPNEESRREVYIYNVISCKKIVLGRFHSPPKYSGEQRCDAHPRFSPDGRSVVIDSPHAGKGRQMYLIDISALFGQA